MSDLNIPDWATRSTDSSKVVVDTRRKAPEPQLQAEAAPVIAVPVTPEAEVDAFEPLFLDGVTFPRATSKAIRSMSAEAKAKWISDRHEAKYDPLVLGNILGFDFQEHPHRMLFNQMIKLLPVNADGTAPDIALIDRQFKKRLVLWPRGVFKTSAVIVLIIQIILNYPDTRIIFLTGGDQLAKNQLARIKKMFEHPTQRFLELFPEFCLTSKFNKKTKVWVDVHEPLGTQKQFTVPCRSTGFTSAEPTMAIYSTKSAKSGLHAEFIFIDDLVNDQNYKNAKMLETVYQHYLDICPLLDPAGMMVLTGTRYSFGDTYERIQNKAHEDGEDGIWKVSVKSCWTYGCLNCSHPDSHHDYSVNALQPPCFYSDCVGYAKNISDKGVLFPKATTRKGKEIGWTLEYLEKLKKDLGASFFANQYENNPVATETQTFTETMIGGVTLHDMNQFPPYLTSATFALCDLAYSDSDDSDLSVIYIFRKFQGALWIFRCISGHWGSADLVANVLKVLQTERPLKMYLEKNLGWEAMDNLIRATADTVGLKSVPIEWIGGASNNKKGAKEIRIKGIQGMISNRRLWLFVGMENYQTLVNQLVKFPRIPHDDYADTLAMVCEAPTGWALETPPQPQSTTNWLHKLHAAGPVEDAYSDTGAGTGIACG
jgi:phage terminase large subunit-like protein